MDFVMKTKLVKAAMKIAVITAAQLTLPVQITAIIKDIVRTDFVPVLVA
jgi:hypothetical protein